MTSARIAIKARILAPVRKCVVFVPDALLCKSYAWRSKRLSVQQIAPHCALEGRDRREVRIDHRVGILAGEQRLAPGRATEAEVPRRGCHAQGVAVHLQQ